MASATKQKRKEASCVKFSYEETRDAFKKLQLHYIKRISVALVKGTVQLWTREKVDAYIEAILDSKSDTGAIPKELSRYEVVLINKSPEKYKLVLKSTIKRRQPIEVIPWEECFDVVVQLHRSFGHRGTCKKLYEYVRLKYVVDRIWISFILRACNICQFEANNQQLPSTVQDDSANYKCYKLFTQIMPIPDGPFTFVFIVVNKSTNFVHLRPLAKFDENSVGLELLKIFADYGMPQVLATREATFYEKVCEYVASLTNQGKIELKPIQMTEQPPSLVTVVVTRLQEWMEITGSQSWSLGCQIVQWQLNNVVRNNTSPYKKMFHKVPINDILG